MTHIHRFAATALALLASAAFGSPLDIPNAPLGTGVGVDPNIMLILDDSGSMQFEILPDSLTSSNAYFLFPRPSSPYGGSTYDKAYLGLDDTQDRNVTLRSSARNVLFYNPTVTYQPWRKADGSSYPNIDPASAPYDPAGRNNCKINLKTGGMTGSNCSRTTLSYPITFYVYVGSGDVTARTNYIRYQYRNGTFYQWQVGTRSNTEQALTTLPWGRSTDEEVQNFANWFSYYRSRILAVQAGVTNAFADLSENFRVGFCTINTCNNRNATPNIAIPTTRKFSGTNKSNFFDTFTKVTINAVGTPLREGLDWAGNNYKKSDDNGPWGPKVTIQGTAKQLSCRQSFTILTTDGYWDTGYGLSELGNSDGTNGPTITSADGKTSYQYTPQNPYKDSYSNTLADVAMEYWKKDLRSDLDNNVPTTIADPAFWQHMTTFALSLGVAGTLTYPDDLAAITAGTKSWPDPTKNKNETRVDDLWHAAVNGHGQFFAAKDPNEFAQGLKNALGLISDRTSSASNVAVNLPQITSDTLVFYARYTPGSWTGELLAYPITANGIGTTAKWTALIPAVASRKLFTSDGSNGGIAFDWTSLTQTQKNALGSQTDAVKQDIVNYLRGDQSKEVKNGGTFRNRKSLLGDIVHSSPVFVDNQQSGNARAQTVFVGANDGMLHAFDATNGQEVFAYVPNLLIGPNLVALSDPAYTHRYFVDGPIAVTWPGLTPGKNILIASLGYGGKGLFALDVTNPKSFSAANVKWEFSNDPDLGLVTGEMVLSKTNDGHTAVIFGNGYNSANEHAVLFVVDLDTGTLIQKIDTGNGPSNGLSAVIGLDTNGDNVVDYIYAGDLNGNLWKFDLSGKNAQQWDVALKQGNTKLPLFHAQDANGKAQPITARPMVGYNPADGSRWVFFGTGRYLTLADVSDTSTQSWYGIIDDGKNAVTRSQLKQRKIAARGTDPKTGNPVRSFEQATPGDMVDTTGNKYRGWYVDLDPGERMITPSQLSGPVLYASSIIPSTDPCVPGGTGYVNAIDAFTGTAVGFFADYGPLTVNGQKIPAGSVDVGGGMPGQPQIEDNRILVPGDHPEDPKKLSTPHRINWRELIRE